VYSSSRGVQRAISRVHDVLTKQITVRDIRLALRLHHPTGKRKRIEEERKRGEASPQSRSGIIGQIRLFISSSHQARRVAIILAVLLFLFLHVAAVAADRTCLHSILIPIRVYGFACSRPSLSACSSPLASAQHPTRARLIRARLACALRNARCQPRRVAAR